MGRLGRVREMLRDKRSRDVFVSVVLAHISNEKLSPLWRGESCFWPESKTPKAPASEQVDAGFRGIKLEKQDLRPYGFDITIFIPRYRPNEIFDLQQYADVRNGVTVKAGDIVIDGGGCWGDSALYFAHETGDHGRVYTFEFLENNLRIMRKNFALNPELSRQITIIEQPLWSEEGITLGFSSDGPATRTLSGRAEEGARFECRTTSIDSLVCQGIIPKVDIIKLDIEGAEPEALAGAANTIKTLVPTLAVCVYHKISHHVELAELIHSLDKDYRFSLDHFSPGPWETVLYAQHPKRE